MPWGLDLEKALLINGGDACPICHTGTVCLNGMLANEAGVRLVNCSSCGVIVCAKCGGPTERVSTLWNKHHCPNCDTGGNQLPLPGGVS